MSACDYVQNRLPFAFDAASEQAKLDVSGQGRRLNALPWRGQFTPDLVDYILGTLPGGRLVVDPFCGSGTTLAEAARGDRASLGVELNPAAFILARVYEAWSWSADERSHYINDLSRASFFSRHNATLDEMRVELIGDTLGKSRLLREAVALLSFKSSKTADRASIGKARSNVVDLVAAAPQKPARLQVLLGDARSIPLPDGAADLVLTSPPYINVFNYHQNYRPVVEALGWEVLPAARAEIGSNRQNRQNRFKTVVQYSIDMAQSLIESARVLEDGSMSVWVVGRTSKVRGVAISNVDIVLALATGVAGMKLVSRRERKFTSRYGTVVFEDVLIFRKDAVKPWAVESKLEARQIGVWALERALISVGDAEDLRSEILSAIALSESIDASPQAVRSKSA